MGTLLEWENPPLLPIGCCAGVVENGRRAMLLSQQVAPGEHRSDQLENIDSMPCAESASFERRRPPSMRLDIVLA